MSRKPKSIRWFHPDWHEVIDHDQSSMWEFYFSLCAVFSVGLLYACRVTWIETFRNGSATANEVTYANLVIGGGGLIGIVLGIFSIVLGWKILHDHLIGHVQWHIYFRSGKVKKILLPRGKRPYVASRREVWYFGVPVGGWFHAVPIYYDEQPNGWRIGRCWHNSFHEKFIDTDRRALDLELEMAVQLFQQAGIKPGLVISQREALADNWIGLLLNANRVIETQRKSGDDLCRRLRETTDDLRQQRSVNAARTIRFRTAYNRILSSTRLVYTTEGRQVAEVLQTGLLIGVPKDSPIHAELSRPLPTKARERRTPKLLTPAN